MHTRDSVRNLNCPIILLGDLNVDLDNPAGDHDAGAERRLETGCVVVTGNIIEIDPERYFDIYELSSMSYNAVQTKYTHYVYYYAAAAESAERVEDTDTDRRGVVYLNPRVKRWGKVPIT